MRSEVRQLIALTLGIEPERVTGELEFASVAEWDSLNHVNLMLALEECFGTQIDADLMMTLTSVRAICEFAARARAGSDAA